MTQIKVEIVRLEAMRVASAYGFGVAPEEMAWRKLAQWARPKGFLDDIPSHPIFGFNNPYPIPHNPRYGYEFWMKVGVDVEPEGDIRIGEFMGGMYAATRCEVQGHPENTIPAGWKELSEWCKENDHPFGPHTALERFHSSPDALSDLVLDLYCPIIS
jgi:DNA gyrase inhibitor GyrI